MVHVFDNVFDYCSNRTFDLYASIHSSSNDTVSSLLTKIFCNTQEIINLQVCELWNVKSKFIDSKYVSKLFSKFQSYLFENWRFSSQIPISLPSDAYKVHVFAVDSVDKKKIFDNSKQLIYERNFVSVVFQTTRPIYSSGQLGAKKIINNYRLLPSEVHQYKIYFNLQFVFEFSSCKLHWYRTTMSWMCSFWWVKKFQRIDIFDLELYSYFTLEIWMF